MERDIYAPHPMQIQVPPAQTRSRLPQPLPRHPNSLPPTLGNNMDRRQRLAANAGVPMMPSQPYYRSTSPYQQRNLQISCGEQFEPHGMMFNELEEPYTPHTPGTRSPSVCSSLDLVFDSSVNLSGSTSCDGLSSLVSSPATQREKLFTFSEDTYASSIDSLSGFSLGFATSPNTSMNIISPTNNSGYSSQMMRNNNIDKAFEMSYEQQHRVPVNRSVPQYPQHHSSPLSNANAAAYDQVYGHNYAAYNNKLMHYQHQSSPSPAYYHHQQQQHGCLPTNHYSSSSLSSFDRCHNNW